MRGFLRPKGYFSDYLQDNIRWLRGEPLGRCDAGRYSIVIDASGNVAPCLGQDYVGNIRDRGIGEIVASFDRDAIAGCSKRSSCNLLCGRIVGATLRHPVSALQAWLAMRERRSLHRRPPVFQLEDKENKPDRRPPLPVSP
jgi:hypothetical protein